MPVPYRLDGNAELLWLQSVRIDTGHWIASKTGDILPESALPHQLRLDDGQVALRREQIIPMVSVAQRRIRASPEPLPASIWVRSGVSYRRKRVRERLPE